MPTEEVIVEFTPSRESPASQTRSTLLTTSLQAIRAHGRFPEYQKLLPRELSDTIVTVVAGVWLPIDIAVAHYSACNALDFSIQEQTAIGMEVGDRVQGTMLGLLVRTAKQAGLTPWTGLSQCNKLYDRLFRGGSVKLIKLGPKEARLEVVNNRLFALAYFRNAFRGLVCAGAQLFCEKAYVHELPKLTGTTSLGMRVSWA
jgi:hypothetical protein